MSERQTHRQKSQRKRKNEKKKEAATAAAEEKRSKIKCQTSHNAAAILMNLVSVLYK